MKKRLIAMFCALILLISALPAASALEGEGHRAADLLAALNLMDEAEDYALGEPALRAQSTALLVMLSGGKRAGLCDRQRLGHVGQRPEGGRYGG